MARSTVLLLLAGCSFTPRASTDDATVGGDDAPPVVVDAPPGSVCVGSGVFEVCIAPEVSGGVSLSGPFDTDTGACTAPSLVAFTTLNLHPDTCFVAGDSISVAGLTVSGSRPLALVSKGDLALSGTLDVAARGDERGPGARATCTTGEEPRQSAGGAGGTYKEAGGDGGNAGDDGGEAGAPESPPGALRGGCPGQNGSGGDGDAGRGGGVLYAAAVGMIAMQGATINASGSGGEGGDRGDGGGVLPGGDDDPGGGGGGGSGGLIYLHAATIDAAGAIIVASGGGGGGGGTNMMAGGDGGSPDMAMPTMAARGGASDGMGGDGGRGYPEPNRTGQNGDNGGGNNGGGGIDQGGGGGGGGPGHVLVNRVLGGATVLPMPTP